MKNFFIYQGDCIAFGENDPNNKDNIKNCPAIRHKSKLTQSKEQVDERLRLIRDFKKYPLTLEDYWANNKEYMEEAMEKLRIMLNLTNPEPLDPQKIQEVKASIGKIEETIEKINEKEDYELLLQGYIDYQRQYQYYLDAYNSATDDDNKKYFKEEYEFFKEELENKEFNKEQLEEKIAALAGVRNFADIEVLNERQSKLEGILRRINVILISIPSRPKNLMRNFKMNNLQMYLRGNKDSPLGRDLSKDPLTEEELEQIAQMQHKTEEVSAEEYTGANRMLPDLLDYKADSILAEIGYTFNDKHKIQGTFEKSVQQYNTRDMSIPSYYDSGDDINNAVRKHSFGTYAVGGNLLDNQYITQGPFRWGNVNPNNKIRDYRYIGLKYAEVHFYDEKHLKKRFGFDYIFTPENKWLDKANLSYNIQSVDLDNVFTKLNCSEYPRIDKHCKATTDKQASFDSKETIEYSEKHHNVRLDLNKVFDMGDTYHDFKVSAGADRSTSLLKHPTYQENHIYHGNDLVYPYDSSTALSGSRENLGVVIIKEPTEKEVVDLCKNASAYRDCNDRIIKGENYFVGLSNLIAINPYLDLNLSYRYDKHNFKTEDEWTSVKNHKNHSFGFALDVKPTDKLALSYKAFTGFRVPSYQEMFGYRVPGYEKGKDDNAVFKSDLSPEQSLNQEINVDLKNDAWALLSTSFFVNDYRNLILLAGKDSDPNQAFRSQVGYYNAQDMKLQGFDVQGSINWNGFNAKLPDGLYTTLAYSQIKPKRIRNTQDFSFVSSNVLDAIQPGKFVAIVGYDHPAEKWGVNTVFSYSKAKNPSEIEFNNLGKPTIPKDQSKAWLTTNMVGYMKIKDNLNVRLGVYNLFDRKYTTWESLRQASPEAINKQSYIGNYNKFVAPGRYFVLSVDMTF